MIKYGEIDPITKKPIVNCPSYRQCPICYMCDNNGVFVRCRRCVAGSYRGGKCRHDERHRNFAIRRENFRIKVVGEEWIEAFRNAEKELERVKRERAQEKQESE